MFLWFRSNRERFYWQGDFGGIDYEIKIPAPPHYLSSMGESRGVAAEEGIISKSLRKPIFVEVNDYRKVIEEITSIQKDSKKSKEVIRALDDFKIKNSAKLKRFSFYG